LDSHSSSLAFIYFLPSCLSWVCVRCSEMYGVSLFSFLVAADANEPNFPSKGPSASSDAVFYFVVREFPPPCRT